MKSSPEMVLQPYSYRSKTAFSWNNQKPPFDYIRVRRAINMAIDLDAIAENYMQGWGVRDGSWVLNLRATGAFFS